MAPAKGRPPKSSQHTVIHDATQDNVGSGSGQRVTRPTKKIAAKASKAGKGRGTGVVVKATTVRKTGGRRAVTSNSAEVRASTRSTRSDRSPQLQDEEIDTSSDVSHVDDTEETVITTTSKTQGREPHGSTVGFAGEQDYIYHSDVDSDSIDGNRQQSHRQATTTAQAGRRLQASETLADRQRSDTSSRHLSVTDDRITVSSASVRSSRPTGAMLPERERRLPAATDPTWPKRSSNVVDGAMLPERERRLLATTEHNWPDTGEDTVERTERVSAGRSCRRSISADGASLPSHSVGYNRHRVETKQIDHSIEMPQFDGRSDVELFLRRFELLAEYYAWSDTERLFRMKQSIRGDAQYMLMDLTDVHCVKDFVTLLQDRFGTAAHAERYRAELSQLRRGSMSLEQLHIQVRTLVSKAAPGPWTGLTEIFARDAFLQALGDLELRRRIMLTCPPPTTLATAYDLALRASAFESYVQDTRNEQRHRSPQRRGERYTRVISGGSCGRLDETSVERDRHKEENRQLQKQIDELRAALSKVTTASTTSSGVAQLPCDRPCSTANQDPGTALKPARSETISRPPFRGLARDACRLCGKRGHWARACPTSRAGIEGPGGVPRASMLTLPRQKRTNVYLNVGYQGRPYRVLLDTGCDISIVSTKILQNLPMCAHAQKLYAANMSAVPVLGKATISFKVAGLDLESEFLVSDAVEELIFGADWLKEFDCIWDFTSNLLTIRASSEPCRVPLISVARTGCVRRLYDTNTVELPSYSQQDILVSSVWSTRPRELKHWMVEPKLVKPGVVMARTLLPEDQTKACVRMVNYGPVACTIPAGELLTIAETVAECTLEEEQPLAGSNYDHIQELLDSLPTELTADQRLRATEFVKTYSHVFSRSATDLGRNDFLPHRINTGTHSPIKQPLRRYPYAYSTEIEKSVQELLAAKVIEPTASPWSSNVLLVKKKDGSLRFCLDYRKLNQATIKDSYPLPRIQSCLESLGGSTYFSTMDLRSGYYQTMLDPRDSEKTAFITRSGQYKFTRLSMGLTNAPSQFQRLMDLTMAGLVWDACLVFLDDVIVFASTFETHLERLKLVFERLIQANLKLKPSKCQLFRREVRFLGHVVSSKGIAADPEKIRAVANWPRPRNLHEVRGFLGLSGYYRRFIESYSSIAKDLHKLTEKGQPFVWQAEQETAFQTLKERLVTAPILASPTDDGMYVLDTDASQVGLGAVLQQQQGDRLVVIAYASRLLSATERNYSTTKRETLAVVFAFKSFRQFLLGRHFRLRVDHSALTYLRSTPEVMGQAARWLDFIEEFDFSCEHRAGRSHGNCDALSRRPPAEEESGQLKSAEAAPPGS